MKKLLVLLPFITISLAAMESTQQIKALQSKNQYYSQQKDLFDSGPYQCQTIIDDIPWVKIGAFVGKAFKKLNVIVLDSLSPIGIIDKGLNHIEYS